MGYGPMDYPWPMEAMCICGARFGSHADDLPHNKYPYYENDCEGFVEMKYATVEDFFQELNS